MSAVDPGVADTRGRTHGRVYWLLADCWNIVRRGLTAYQRQPVMIAWQLGFPILSVLLYGYVFGSAMRVPGDGDYRDFLMPGMFVMTMAFGFINTATIVVYDSTKGVIDRFRSMPMASSAVVAGRGVTDLIVACAELAIMMLTAFAMGWRPDGGWGFLAAFGLLLWLRFALIWIGVWLGLIVPNPEAAGGLFAVAFPLTMISSIFVAPGLMPDWLGHVAAWNPVSSTAAATRELFGTSVGGGDSWVEQHALLMAGVWPVVLTAIFLPLAVRRFQKLSG
ncbi:multidrug ABC transporter permease [Streptomyces phaeoluteigriseus]|uniref:Transport permease protein n=1 Tax=Streptomyces phaeoluteigriseus TaxID=114686 RepID=A0A1V6MTQ5_9ACTN|nr:ABC transporter permease [Streptomyces phaeoluteigriseus]OQD55854.1 multidrug ABC transporter permease [Streptomyces phaeoluteigriseus]